MNPKFETSPVSRGRRFSHVQLFADFGYYHEECSHRKYHPRNNQMDLARTEAVLLNGKRLSLDESLPEVVQALMNDGCALLKRATNLKPVEPFLATDMNSLESVRKEIVLNETIRAILFSARDDDFRITGYQAFKVGIQGGGMSRDRQWQEIAAEPKLVGVYCIHLGGDWTVQWSIDVDKGSGKGIVEANGGDIFVCTHWLRRSAPRLLRQPPLEAALIAVSYLWHWFSSRGRMVSGLGDKIIEVGDDYCWSGEFVLWKHDASSI